MMKQATVVVVGAFLSGVSVVGAQAPDPAKIAAGKTLYVQTKCAKCHGQGGVGDKSGKLSLQGISAKLSATEIHKWIASPAEMTAKLPKKPKEAMKKFDLSEPQVEALVAYVQSLKK